MPTATFDLTLNQRSQHPLFAVVIWHPDIYRVKTKKMQAHWAVKSEVAAARVERGRQVESERKEMDFANLDLLTRRTARLKDLYEQLNKR